MVIVHSIACSQLEKYRKEIEDVTISQERKERLENRIHKCQEEETKYQDMVRECERLLYVETESGGMRKCVILVTR